MFYLNYKYNVLLCILLVGSCLLLSACGTAERAASSDEKKPGRTGKRVPPATPEEPTAETPASPAAKTLIIAADKGTEAVRLIENGRASWYGPNFHGRLTANGEQYDMHGMTAAHRTLPFNTLVLVDNIDSGKSVVVRINDRGPFAKNRIIDLSKKAASEIGMIGPGIANVKLYVAKNALQSSGAANLKVATYTVQLGSFKTEAQAFTYSSRIKGSRVEIVRRKNKKIYRVYYGLYIDKDEAAQKQKELERKNYSGYVKQLENG